MKRILWLICGSIVAVLAARGQEYRSSVTLAWDHSVSPSAAGYKAYIGGASQSYTNHADVGYTTNATFRVLPNTTYFFAATAYNQQGQEGPFSNEAAYTTPIPPLPTTPPQAPTNAVVISASIEVSTNGVNWDVVTNITVGATQGMFRSKMTISPPVQSKTTTQKLSEALRLQSEVQERQTVLLKELVKALNTISPWKDLPSNSVPKMIVQPPPMPVTKPPTDAQLNAQFARQMNVRKLPQPTIPPVLPGGTNQAVYRKDITNAILELLKAK